MLLLSVIVHYSVQFSTVPGLNPLEFQTLTAYRCVSLCLSVFADTQQAAGD